MYPYIDIGPVHLGTFGLLLWLAAVIATVVLHKNFMRSKVDADALTAARLLRVLGEAQVNLDELAAARTTLDLRWRIRPTVEPQCPPEPGSGTHRASARPVSCDSCDF